MDFIENGEKIVVIVSKKKLQLFTILYIIDLSKI